jgi:hypothetical protein
MLKFPLFILLALSGLFFSCSKDIRHTNKVHGTWDITGLEHYSGNSVTFSADPEGVFQFNKCQVYDADFRAFRQQYTYTIGGTTVARNETGQYSFDDDGQLLIVHIPTDNGTRETVYHLVSLKHKELVIEHRSPAGERTVLTLRKK